MRTITVPEPEPFDEEDAEEVIHLTRDVETDNVSAIYVDLNDPFLNRPGARAIALRLLALADEWDRLEARPQLRRVPDIDEHLRNRDV
ncbi:hypothetical protein [Microbacterium sp. Leaf179]|uniref:hypothetical protein n=1 Tax=Microbacterium sp. Leaf179 TaxID=1736288 RepID=UPI0006F3BFA7|nr:hypothetical protein [Microbacterium sp. Leaf179]KQR88740.1 hypothetical protein ASF96_02935 [Microbacterium sp. Leaf179]